MAVLMSFMVVFFNLKCNEQMPKLMVLFTQVVLVWQFCHATRSGISELNLNYTVLGASINLAFWLIMLGIIQVYMFCILTAMSYHKAEHSFVKMNCNFWYRSISGLI